jgi:hypothetical protein
MNLEAITINSFMHYNRNLSKSSKFLIKKVVNNLIKILVLFQKQLLQKEKISSYEIAIWYFKY